MQFTALTHPAGPEPARLYWFLFKEGRLLVLQPETAVEIPCWERTVAQDLVREFPIFLGMLDEIPAYGALFREEAPTPAGTGWVDLRPLYERLDATVFWVAARAAHLLHWDLHTRFCGCCGAATAMMTAERAKVCS